MLLKFETISHQDRLFFTKHLATMIKAGVPLYEAVETLEDQSRSRLLRKILKAVVKDIKNGSSLHEALKSQGQFSQLYLSLIKIGEESGTLEENLDFLSTQLYKDYNLRNKINAALMYPGLVFFSTVIMGGFIALYVLPKLVSFFEAFEFELPLSTKILLFIANTSKNYGILILAGIILAVMAFLSLIKIPKIRLIWHTQILKLPLLGQLLWYNQLARFTRNFGILLKSGLPIVKSLEVSTDTLSNYKFKESGKKIVNLLEKGKSIHQILESKQFRIFPPLVRKMIAVGEETGKLDETLMYLGDFYEEEIDSISKNFATVLEPILLLVIGLIVGFVALAIISPIYELTGSIRR